MYEPHTIERNVKYMSDKEFWKILAKLDWSKKGEVEEIVEPVIQCLTDLSCEELDAFEERMNALLSSFLNMDFGNNNEILEDIILKDDFISDQCIAVVNNTHYYQAIRTKKSDHCSSLTFEAIVYTLDDAYLTGEVSYIA